MDEGALLTGGAVAIFAFLLATGRDALRVRRERSQRDKSVLAAIREEIAANRRVAENNQALLAKELEWIAENKRLINPLDPLERGFWELVKLDPPKPLARQEHALADVREVARLTDQVNEMLRSREAFRVLSPTLTMTTFTEEREEPSWVRPLRAYDQLLQRFQGELLEAITRVERILKDPD